MHTIKGIIARTSDKLIKLGPGLVNVISFFFFLLRERAPPRARNYWCIAAAAGRFNRGASSCNLRASDNLKRARLRLSPSLVPATLAPYIRVYGRIRNPATIRTVGGKFLFFPSARLPPRVELKLKMLAGART